MRYANFKPIDSVDGTTDPTSAPIDSTSFQSFSVQSISTGTLTGNMQVQASNVPEPAASDWADVGAPIPVVAPDSKVQVVPESPFQKVRVKFTSTGGAGNITAALKSVGW